MATTVLLALQRLGNLQAEATQQLRASTHHEAVRLLIQQARQQLGKPAPLKAEQDDDERAAKRIAPTSAVSPAPSTAMHGNACGACAQHGSTGPSPPLSTAPAREPDDAGLPMNTDAEQEPAPQQTRQKRTARGTKSAAEKPAKQAKARGGTRSKAAKAATSPEPAPEQGQEGGRQQVDMPDQPAATVPVHADAATNVPEPNAAEPSMQAAEQQPALHDVDDVAQAPQEAQDPPAPATACVAFIMPSATATASGTPHIEGKAAALTPQQPVQAARTSAAATPQLPPSASSIRPGTAPRRSTRHTSLPPKAPTPKNSTPAAAPCTSVAQVVQPPADEEQLTVAEAGTHDAMDIDAAPKVPLVTTPSAAGVPAPADAPAPGGDFQFQSLPCLTGTPDNMPEQPSGTKAPPSAVPVSSAAAPASQRARSNRKPSTQPSASLPKLSPQPVQQDEAACAKTAAVEEPDPMAEPTADVQEGPDSAVQQEPAAAAAEAQDQDQPMQDAPASEAVPAPAPAAAASAKEVPKGHNLLSTVRSFVPAKRPASPLIAAGKKQVKVKALEAAQAAKRMEEAKAAVKARLKDAQQKPAAAAAATEGDAPASTGGETAATAPGTVKARVAAMQSRIQADEEARRREEAARRQQEKDDLAKQTGAATAATAAAAPAAPPQAATEPVKGTAGAGGGGARLDAAEKQRRAEAKRREDEEKRKAEVEMKIRAKEERAKKLAAGHAAQAASAALAASGKAGAAQGPAGAKGAARPGQPQGAAAGGAAQPPASQPEAKEKKEAEKAVAPKMQQAEAAPEPLQVQPLAPHQISEPPATVKSTKQQQKLLPRTPAEAAEEARNVQELMTSPYVNPGTHRTPGGARSGLKSGVKLLTSYEISPYKESSDDEDDMSPHASRKPIPDWAHPVRLMDALRKQSTLDPDKIFSTKQKTCGLDDVFAGMPPPPPPDPAQAAKAHKKRDWHKRGSSGNWIADRLTWQEEIQYKRQMGYL